MSNGLQARLFAERRGAAALSSGGAQHVCGQPGTGGGGGPHSHSRSPSNSAPADEVADPYAGLTGAIVIGRKGELKDDLTAKDVDK